MTSFPDLLDEWRSVSTRDFLRHPTITAEGLVLGAGTVLAKHGHDGAGMATLDSEGREDRILALLAVTYGRPISPGVLGNFRRAAQAYARGEKAIAHMHLAFTGLHGLEDAERGSFRLFLAERLLAAGLSPRKLLAALEIEQPEYETDLYKATPDDPKHPGWPAGTAGGLGGKFRPKDGTPASISDEAAQRIKAAETRFRLRVAALVALSAAAEVAAGLIPGLGTAAALATLAELASTVAEFKKLKVDAAALNDFVNDGPHSFEDLQVDLGSGSNSGYAEFSSYDEFIKVTSSAELIAKRFGAAGDGYEYHHVVTQGGANATNPDISPEQLQNTDNIVRIPTILHQAINAAYCAKQPDTNLTVYEWLQTQPYDVQYKAGLKIMRDLNIIK